MVPAQSPEPARRSKTALDILFLSHRLPYPPDRGDRIRSYHMIRHLARRHRVSVAAVTDERTAPEHLHALGELCQSVDVGYLSPLRRYTAAARHLPTAMPLTVPMFACPSLQARIDERIRRGTFDLIFIYCSGMAPYVLHHDLPKVVDFIDADSQKWLDYARASRSPLAPVYWREGWLLRRFERRVAEACRHAFVSSERDAELLRATAPGAPLTVLPNGVSIPAPAPMAAAGRRLVFTGVMNYRPNVDAMTYFAREMFPLIRRRVPDAELYIVGQGPTREILDLVRTPGITVTGRVDDVLPYLRSAAAFVAPLRIARGIQNKVLEAMAARVPVVATRAALGGIRAMAGREVLVGDTPELFAAHTVSLLLDAGRRIALREAAGAFVEAHHRWDVHLERMEAVLLEIAQQETTRGLFV
jgi:sugar transferase (PEP-CTERM/EpsH1 system associated)